MEPILNFLGFTDMISTSWNLLGYTGMILIIIGVLFAKWRNRFFVWGPFILLIYAWFFLHDPILVGLQLVVTTSGVLNLRNIKKRAAFIIIALSAVVFGILLITGQLFGLGSWIGALGLWGIALGFTQLPRKRGFTFMTLGGFLIMIYAFVFQVWVFFILNIFYVGVTIIELKKKEKN